MILVFGGAYNGKLSFVKEKFNISDEEILTLNNIDDLEIDFSKKVINKFQNLTYKMFLENQDPLKYILENESLFKDKIIISDDICEGIVPLKKEDRIWRENTGKCLQYLSKNSKEVYRVFCGIPMVIKDE
ncbi:bifunctional adenosylcobinamide kinase/adenosylcobinamide-phosphate guanylyltransferase [Clostridium tertium]|uniref:bifunctional adenosylcobinamide kinase/adenosylcobinamide-phosphate guanylyltransferase n=1 Tax=Clostridium tertium TaxID=1559 RepID=UPI00232B2074|nr:bifunctional adenosylcobinamide kinase/adenosylcobinamide-phosphate guanylyltransferase [Clostridium tertium]MDB1954300.1 bifunctional adenosylcobinamide kinase/adenosylcobinamide-phosphate guanylyltransferase [Clostridium tertium]MDB1957283.1 bifunctional adenosylcobinamide kinase/adenosylcobinamide-phosphate guanylyltransferase [Clostridium tertium]MDB1963129.1 bifunctional adenosylcobinamide kinase/adenosylcobinamide-phosphate guanylyltransferase [Clostridium tertium]MDB1965801.1 bifuncti